MGVGAEVDDEDLCCAHA